MMMTSKMLVVALTICSRVMEPEKKARRLPTRRLAGFSETMGRHQIVQLITMLGYLVLTSRNLRRLYLSRKGSSLLVMMVDLFVKTCHLILPTREPMMTAVVQPQELHLQYQTNIHLQTRETAMSSLASNRSVPELSIEIPPNATVGSLKRMVMEAVSAILCNGLRVAIFVQGKWVRDDNKTVLQAGICQDDKNHSCGFMLEPRYSHVASPSSAESRSFLSSRSAGGQSRHASPRLRVGSSSSSTVASEIDEHIRVFPLADGSTDRASSPDSKALVRVPAIRMESLAIVPFQQKSGQQELGQRRVRRPFSVSEVEALVQAVEKLGTGRWRDVKLRAFDYVNHRTHVDLKDKWKTLVHTARISPQQRRGEPVPQQLLDRVLAAHAYWSQQQSTRQQPKSTA
ncbi:Telomere repeat-binding protein 3 [Linum perenne]